MILVYLLSATALILAAVLRAGMTSALRTNRGDALKDAAEGKPGAQRIARLLEKREGLHPSINAVHSFLLLLGVAPATWLLTREVTGVSVFTGVAVAVLGFWVVGDFLARGVGRARPATLAYRLAPILALTVRFGRAANELIADDQSEPEDVPAEAATEELEEERELIDSVLEFTETIVREVMVPRQDMITIPVDSDVSQLATLSAEKGFSRYPVTDHGGEVVGLVLTKDVLGAHAAGQEISDLTVFIREIPFVPENKRASDLLREMQANKTHLVMVVDEYGDITGLASIEDLLEELVGEIVDEFDPEEELIEQVEEGVVRVDGRLDVQTLGDTFEVELPSIEWDTVAGLVLGLAGRVPEEGERFEINGLELEVDRLQGRRVSSILARRT
jgi:CBS domain containing-hemolysin-like protein